MKKFYSAMMVLCVYAFAFASQSSFAPVWAQEGPAKNFLWKISSPTTVVYLYGSIHLGKPEMYPLAGPVEEAFATADSLVVEVNVDAVDPAYAQQLMVHKGTYQRGESIYDQLSPKTSGRLRQHLQTRGISSEQFAVFKPWLAAVTLTVMQIEELGFDAEYGVDRYFLNRAEGKKTILELESFEEQIQFFDAMDNQDLFLYYTLESMDETEEMLNELIRSWSEGDTAAMEKIVMTDILEEDPRLLSIFEKILFDRNVRMAAYIEDYLTRPGVYFVVVGAAHLITEKGIVALLEQSGYSVEQL